jgi:hypothetical protein
MEPIEFYKKRLEELTERLHKLKQRKSSFAWLRLGAVIAIVAAFYFLWSLGVGYVIGAIILLLLIFIQLIKADLRNHEKIEHTSKLININKNELEFLSGNYFVFEDGSEHIPKEHAYANDLDIFGRASLFQYFNRTTSEPGSRQLAEYLKAPSAISEIPERQKAIKELSTKTKWAQDMQANGEKNKITFSTISRLEKWMKEPDVFSGFKAWKWLRYVLPVIILTIIVLYIFNVAGDSIFYGSLFIFAIIAYQVNKFVAPVHEQLSKASDELSTLYATILLIENENFKSSLLQNWQSVFRSQNKKASDDILKIKKILDKLDIRYNIVLSAPLNLLLLWNLQQVLDLEKWKRTAQDNFSSWFQTLAYFEAINSFAVVAFNHSEWVFPVIRDEYFSVEGKEIGHPLIAEDKRVNNFIDIPRNSELMLVTGSNMAGKSTYLRSIGINVVLAMTGAPVCAQSFSVSHVQLISSMRITDNLEESTSTFYAELKKLKTIIEKVNAGEKVFILLDEILRGTNSLDRHTGSKALIRQLIKKKAAAVIATHDLELANLKEDFFDNILNYHFDVQVSNDELYFDYRLKPGVCNSLNASILMKKIGIEL